MKTNCKCEDKYTNYHLTVCELVSDSIKDRSLNTMKKDLASARPWDYDNNMLGLSKGKKISHGFKITGSDGKSIVNCPSSCKKNVDEQQANAELIVRAVNNFDALLEACKNIIASADAIGRDGIFAQEFKQIRQAIANAEK